MLEVEINLTAIFFLQLLWGYSLMCGTEWMILVQNEQQHKQHNYQLNNAAENAD